MTTPYRTKDPELVAIRAASPSALADYFTGRKTIGVTGQPAVEAGISMPCGQVVRYESLEELPTYSLRCPCGAAHHWLVLFDSREEAPVGEGEQEPEPRVCVGVKRDGESCKLVPAVGETHCWAHKPKA